MLRRSRREKVRDERRPRSRFVLSLCPWIETDLTARNLSAYLSPRDMNQLIRKCIEVEDVDFAIVHGISNNRVKRLSIDETRRLVAMSLQDDGFEKYHQAWLKR